MFSFHDRNFLLT